MKNFNYLLITFLGLCLISCAENQIIEDSILNLIEVSEVDEVDGIDNDGLTDEEEITGIDDPVTPANPNGNITDPEANDTDGDGMPDGQEAIDGTDPNDIDDTNEMDRDGLTNEEEITGIDNPLTPPNPDGNITDPEISDTDGDGKSDGEEAIDGTDPNDEDDNKEDIDDLTTAIDNCIFESLGVDSGNTININCSLDLAGQTINIPEDVTLEFDGGEIFNGTLNFGDNGQIDGELLNSKLLIEGNASLTSEDFQFYPNRWGIIEGKVNDEVARNNRDILEANMITVKNLGAKKFIIGKIDAYFKVDEPTGAPVPSLGAITVPSDYHLLMSDETHIRMQPNSYSSPTLLATFRASNVIIEGGILHGDREEHDYSDGGTHEWGHTLRISGSDNIVVKNMTFMDAAGDGLDVHGDGHSFDPHYKTSENVLIIDNIFIRNRRNQISITDGNNIIVERNEFIDTSINTSTSRGVAPGFGIDIEAVIGSNPAGPSEIAEDIIVRNNIESGGRLGAITVHTGDRVTIEDNIFENNISYTNTRGTIIRNNEITGKTSKNTDRGTAIVAGRIDFLEKNYDNEVYGNIIRNYAIGIVLTNTRLGAFDNQIIDCSFGISIEDLNHSEIYDNVITSSIDNSNGIVNGGASEYIDDVIIEKNSINVTNAPIRIFNINTESEYAQNHFEIKDNILNSSESSIIVETVGFTFIENTINEGYLFIVESENGNINKNNIITSNNNGIRIEGNNSNLSVLENIIDSTQECILNDDLNNSSLTIANNQCE